MKNLFKSLNFPSFVSGVAIGTVAAVLIVLGILLTPNLIARSVVNSVEGDSQVANIEKEAGVSKIPSETIPEGFTVTGSDQLVGTESATENPPSTVTPIAKPACQQPERILLIVIDGLRSDAVWEKRTTPFLLELAESEAAYTWNAHTVVPPLTIPAHTSLFTGYDSTTHGLLENKKYLDQHKKDGTVLELPTIFTRLKDKDETAMTVLVSGKEQHGFFLQPEVEIQTVHEKVNDQIVFIDVEQIILNYGFDLMFIDFGFTDITGHEYNWMSGEYITAVRGADRAIQSLFSLLEERDMKNRTMIFITADHGGIQDYHGANVPETRTIPWMVIGPCVKKGEIPEEADIRIFDTAPTIMWLLDMDIPENLDGRVLNGLFEGLPDPVYVSPESIMEKPLSRFLNVQ